ncbi:hypothetical protein GTY75_33035 [Streptomyces sp. SID8381]|uniref:hypothetical protein n=1 Tax=unclassified Streptomyces TaxID=2593676 RepID=UPI00131A16B6|nr:MULTISPECIES: hypothetical protein [unclassified Streptomyces]MYX31390.1 hypothetical protein [Streptomyces sp. SID8381]
MTDRMNPAAAAAHDLWEASRMFARRAVGLSLACVAFGVLTGCSGSAEQKQYDVPEALCGIAVQQDLLSPLLPAGKKVTVEELQPLPRRSECRVKVDGQVALLASREWWEQGDGLSTVARSIPQLESAQLEDGTPYMYSGTGGAEEIKSCRSQKYADHVLFAAIQVYGKDVNDAAGMKKLITAYSQGVASSDACR